MMKLSNLSPEKAFLYCVADAATEHVADLRKEKCTGCRVVAAAGQRVYNTLDHSECIKPLNEFVVDHYDILIAKVKRARALHLFASSYKGALPQILDLFVVEPFHRLHADPKWREQTISYMEMIHRKDAKSDADDDRECDSERCELCRRWCNTVRTLSACQDCREPPSVPTPISS